MKQPGILKIVGIALMSFILSTGAQTMPETENCLGVTSNSITNIGISWEKACYPDDTFFDIELIGTSCKIEDYECTEEDLCIIDTNSMSCSAGTIKACTSVNFNVIGNKSEIPHQLTVQAAPWIKTTEWNLDNSNITDSTLYASWGPPANPVSEFVTCATRVYVAAICSGDVEEYTPVTNPLPLDPPGEGNATIDLYKCNEGDVTLTVTYLCITELGDFPTETKGSTTLYKQDNSTYTTPSISTTDFNTDTSNTTTQEPSEYSNSPQWWEILLIVIASIAGFVLIVFLIYCIVKKKYCFENC